MDRCLLTFFIGSLLSLFLPIVPDFSYVFIILCLFFILFSFKKVKILVSFLLGASWMLYQGASYNDTAKQLHHKNIYEKPIVITGKIQSLVTNSTFHNNKSNTQRMNMLVDTINGEMLVEKINIRLSWQRHSSDNFVKRLPDGLQQEHEEPSNNVSFTNTLLKQHQRWQLPVKLKPAHGLANVGGFHYQQWLRKNNVIATGYVKNKDIEKIQLLNEHISVRQMWFDKVTQASESSTLANNTRNMATFLALTFGVRDTLTKDDWHILQATGTQHIIAISGLHIGLIATSSYFLFLFFVKRLPLRLLPSDIRIKLLQLNIYYIAITVSVCSALFYSYLAGFSSPTLRAFIMLAIFWLANVFAVKLSKVRLFLLTLCSIVILQPMSLLGIGFWLSCYAVTVIFFIHWLYLYKLNQLPQFKKYLYSLLLIQLGLSLFILPVAALLNNQLPIVSMLANLVAVPVISLLILPVVFVTFLSHMLFEIPILFDLTNRLLTLFWSMLSGITQYSGSMIILSTREIYLLFGCVLLFTFSLLKNDGKRYFISLAMLPLALIFIPLHSNNKHSAILLKKVMLKKTNSSHQSEHLVNNQKGYVERTFRQPWQVHVFDVGQGLSVLIERHQRAILYDTGASYPSGFVLAEAVVIPYLKYKGINQLDAVIISHSDNDHAGGLSALKKQTNIQQLIANDKTLLADDYCQKGKQLTWQGLTFTMLWPEKVNSGEHNDDSCVIMVSDGASRVLLPGDISKKVESSLINSAQGNLTIKANVLVAPHHGSNTSSSKAFIEAVQPDYVVFSAGFRNRWRMPTQKVKQRYQEANITQFNTADSGMVTFTFSMNKKIKVHEYRQHTYPFWFTY